MCNRCWLLPWATAGQSARLPQTEKATARPLWCVHYRYRAIWERRSDQTHLDVAMALRLRLSRMAPVSFLQRREVGTLQLSQPHRLMDDPR